MGEVTHRCPPTGSGTTPCCGRTPFELPVTDRLTLDPADVTCPEAEAQLTPDGVLTIDLSHLGRDVVPGDLLRIEHRDGRSVVVQVVKVDDRGGAADGPPCD